MGNKLEVAVIFRPARADVEKVKAKDRQSWELLSTFCRHCTVQYVQNLSIPQTMRLFKTLTDQHERSFPDLAAKLTGVAVYMLTSTTAREGSETDELAVWLDLTPAEVIASCNSQKVEDELQHCVKAIENEYMGIRHVSYYQMQICMTRHKGVCTVCYAAVTSMRGDMMNLFRGQAEKREQLQCLKIATREYLAEKMIDVAPRLAVKDSPPCL